MKKHSFLSVILIIALCCTMLLPISAAAAALGDVDGDGSVKASDARLALRASVGLEKLTDTQFSVADVDFDGAVKAVDARLILRASVGLEELKSKDIIFNGHKVDSDCIGIEKGITCIDPDCDCNGKEVMPSFNELVNNLKTPGSRNYFYGFSKTTENTEKPTCKPSKPLYAGLASTMNTLLADSVVPGKITEYSDFTNNRHINNATFYVHGKSYVSDLKDEDIKSIKMEKMTGIDFLKSLPSSFESTVSGAKYDLSTYKNADIGEVYKVTVTLNTEKMTNKNMPEETTPIEKLINADYNRGLKQNMASLDSAFDEMPEMKGMLGMEMEIATDCEVVYYFTTDTYEAVACTYTIKMNTSSLMHTYFNNLFQKTSDPTTTLTIKSDSTQESFYFFNTYFNAQ